jgi:hypothetical protein
MFPYFNISQKYIVHIWNLNNNTDGRDVHRGAGAIFGNDRGAAAVDHQPRWTSLTDGEGQLDHIVTYQVFFRDGKLLNHCHKSRGVSL